LVSFVKQSAQHTGSLGVLSWSGLMMVVGEGNRELASSYYGGLWLLGWHLCLQWQVRL